MAVSNEEAYRIVSEVEARTGNNRALEEVLVEEVTADPNHPLRDVLEWDPAVAIHQYHLDQMRKFIRRIKVVVRDIHDTPVRVSGFIRNPTQPAGTYIPMERLRADPDVAIEYLQKEADRVKAALTRMEKHASVIPGMEDQLTALRQQIAALQRRLAR